MRRILIIGGVLAVAAATVLLSYQLGKVSPQDLAARAERSAPTWANYQEDIKAQIGAKPVAEWKGRPVAASRSGDTIDVTFVLEGPWADRPAAMPILLRDPYGGTYRNASAMFAPPHAVYRFHLADTPPNAPVPWVELLYPHRQTRIVLDDTGLWAE